MKLFSNNEKKIINKIIELHSQNQLCCAYNIFFDIKNSLYGLTSGFDLRIKDGQIFLYVDPGKYTDQSAIKTLYFDKNTDFYEFIFLMDFLVREEFIALAEKEPSDSKPANWYHETDFLSKDLQKKLTKYFSCDFYPSNKLYDLVSHNFIDERERKERHRYKVTTAVAVFSAIATLFSAIVGIIGFYKIRQIEIINKDSTTDIDVAIIKSIVEEEQDTVPIIKDEIIKLDSSESDSIDCQFASDEDKVEEENEQLFSEEKNTASFVTNANNNPTQF